MGLRTMDIAVDLDTHTTKVYARLQALLDEEEGHQFLCGMYPYVMEVFGREGWDNPAIDIYNDLDPRRKP